jgi:uncharacterized protein
MTDIIETILATLPAEPVEVQNVIVGLHWTLVKSKQAGLASTLFADGPHGHGGIREVGNLQKKSAQELASWLRSDNLLEASLGMAAINSLIELDTSNVVEINAADVIAKECQNKNLVVVGHFPFVDRMKSIARNCWVIEKKPLEGDFSEDAASTYLPQADMIAITATAFINHTMNGLLALRNQSAKIVVLGPSTPLTPVLFDFGITFLSGSRIIDEKAAITTIQQGAIFPQVKGTQLFTMVKPT